MARKFGNNRGATVTEYAVLLSFLVVAALGATFTLSDDVRDAFGDSNSAIEQAIASSAQSPVSSTPVVVAPEEPEEGAPLVLVFRKSPRFEVYRISDSADFPEPRIDWGPGGEACATDFPKTDVSEQDMVHWDELNHTYACDLGAGEHRVKVYGSIHTLTEFGADLLAVESWGDTQIRSLEYAFAAVTLPYDLPSSLPSSVRDMSHAFGRAFKTTDHYPPYHPEFLQAPPQVPAVIAGWDMGNVQEFDRMFIGQSPMAFPDLTGWNVSAGETFNEMFALTTFNQPIGVWNTASLETTARMFWENPNFNRDLNSWDVSGMHNADGMFHNAVAFNGDVSGWDTGRLVNASGMFDTATAFNSDVSNWDVKYMMVGSFMFRNATAFSHDLSGWNVASLYSTKSMFENAINVRGDYSIWRPGDVYMPGFWNAMFLNAPLVTGNLECWNGERLIDGAESFSVGSGIVQDPLWGQPRPATCVD